MCLSTISNACSDKAHSSTSSRKPKLLKWTQDFQPLWIPPTTQTFSQYCFLSSSHAHLRTKHKHAHTHHTITLFPCLLFTLPLVKSLFFSQDKLKSKMNRIHTILYCLNNKGVRIGGRLEGMYSADCFVYRRVGACDVFSFHDGEVVVCDSAYCHLIRKHSFSDLRFW